DDRRLERRLVRHGASARQETDTELAWRERGQPREEADLDLRGGDIAEPVGEPGGRRPYRSADTRAGVARPGDAAPRRQVDIDVVVHVTDIRATCLRPEDRGRSVELRDIGRFDSREAFGEAA